MRLTTALLAIVVLATACSTEQPATTTTTPAPLAALELATDGLGDVEFGLSPEAVIADISALYGEPDHDSGWIPAEPNIYGTCPGDGMRAIGWGSLVTLFTVDATSDLGGWFFAWTFGYDYTQNAGGIDPRNMDLSTAEGIGLGSTVAELEAALGTGLTIVGDETLDVWTFTAAQDGWRGLLSGGTQDDTVTLIESIDGCGE